MPLVQRPAPPPPGWSGRELATLASIFEAVAPGDATRHANLAAAALSQVTDPDALRQLRLVLRALDSRVGNGATGGGWRRFSEVDRAGREAILWRWASSRLAMRRTAFQAFKRLASFFAYADAGPSGDNPTWTRLGYALVTEPVMPEPPAIQPLADDGAATPLELDADVVVVGSGAGGGVVAARLAEAGRSVVVLEAGDYVPEGELSPNELDGFDRLYLDHGLVATEDLSIAILAGGTLGGGTTVNWMTSIPLPERIGHRWAAEHGLDGLDEAEGATDLARLRTELGFVPPVNMPPKDQLILDGARALGWEAAPTERDAWACGDCGACGFGCPSGAKRAGPRLHLAAAAAAGARIVVRARVARLLLAGGRATGVCGWIERADGTRRPFTVHAPQIVVAAGALRTPVVLLRSGLGHPAIGDYLRLHPVPVLSARLAQPVRMWRGVLQAARSAEFAAPGPAGPGGIGPAHGGFLIESAPAHPGLIALAFPWRSRAVTDALLGSIAHHAPLIGITADVGHGRVRLSRHGVPLIRYRLAPSDAQTARRALVEMARLARAGGALELLAVGTPPAILPEGADEGAFAAYLERLAAFDFAPNRGALFSAHQMGTARAGRDPRTSACDGRGHVRTDTRGGLLGGCYVADTSLFPTATGVNPMVSAMQLAARVARTVLAEA
ncbi:MAG: GMC family oxidoreductase N-terminal domain-containing protein [Candidatus Limnocylindrales bacterium]